MTTWPGALLLLAACDPYATWPDPETVYPWAYTPQSDLEDWEQVRWETETWDPSEGGPEVAMYAIKASRHRTGAPAESLAHFEAMRPQVQPPAGDGLRLAFVGDAMWLPAHHATFADRVAPMLEADLAVGNLETPTSPDHPTEQGALGLYAFNAPPALLDGLPLDLLQVNNNHSLDAGDAGLEATLSELEARGMAWTGVDRHATLPVAGREVAFLSYTWGLNQRDAASAHELFVVPFGHLGEAIDLAGIAADIAAARDDGADHVVLLLHWGFEYEYYPDPHFLRIGRELVAAGADLIVGQGPHVVQPPELCHVNRPEHVPGVGTCSVRTDDGAPRTAAILYSLGNFGSTMSTVQCETGLVATVQLGDDGVQGMSWAAVTNVDDSGQGPVLHPLADLAGEAPWAEESARLDAHLGPHWRSP